MAYVISDSCVSCGSCAGGCPAGAISLGDEAVVIISLTVYKMAECMSDLFEGLYQQRFRFDISGRSQFTKDLIMIKIGRASCRERV